MLITRIPPIKLSNIKKTLKTSSYEKTTATQQTSNVSLHINTSHSPKEVLDYVLNVMEGLQKDLLNKKKLEDILDDYQSILLPNFSRHDPMIEQLIHDAYARLRIEILKLSLNSRK